MPGDPDSTEAGDGEAEIVASVDSGDATERLIIADVTRDESWIAIAVSEAPDLESWR